jgi:hypothetical protein
MSDYAEAISDVSASESSSVVPYDYQNDSNCMCCIDPPVTDDMGGSAEYLPTGGELLDGDADAGYDVFQSLDAGVDVSNSPDIDIDINYGSTDCGL